MKYWVLILFCLAFWEIKAQDKSIPKDEVSKIKFEKTNSTFRNGKFTPLHKTNIENTPFRDTLTRGGWNVNYLYLKENPFQKDVFINYSKDDFSNIVRYEHVLGLRIYFTPDYVMESDKRLYFEHGCATYCNAVSVFSKSSKEFKKIEGVVHQNFEEEVFIFNLYEEPNREIGYSTLGMVDFKNNKEYRLYLKGICYSNLEPFCLKSTIVGKDTVIIEATINRLKENGIYKEVVIKKVVIR